MLALYSPQGKSNSLTLFVVALMLITGGVQARGQQLPSQRYQPVGQVATPQATIVTADHQTDVAVPPAPSIPLDEADRMPPGRVVPAAYQEAESAIPDILAGQSTAMTPLPAQADHAMPPKSPGDFANAIQANSTGFQLPGALTNPANTQPTAPVEVRPVANAGDQQRQEALEMASLRGTQTAPAVLGQPRVQPLEPAATEFSPQAVPETQEETASAPMVRDLQVQPASRVTTPQEPTGPTLRLSAPALEVLTTGPETIGINKPALYQVVVQNNSASQADRVLVGIDFPEWVDLENINLTSGDKELTDGKKQARLVWSIPEIAGNSTQTITFTAIPRKAEVFGVGVEWTLVPRTGKTTVQVTEPKLEMTISGPREVLYGETALYHVAVRNPGTGAAEGVNVMLPEALGGERASLGDIGPGKEKNFQVELLARTAGDLNLVATATAEGQLTTSAERALRVRRANLEIAMSGPPLKYAGGTAKYTIKISNTGDAAATELVSAVALPPGVKYLSGIDAAKLIEGGLRWPVGSLDPGQTRAYELVCQLDTSGKLQLEVGARGKGDLAGSSACVTVVETVADLVLTVVDPKGPLPTGEAVPYTIKIRNRGSKAAENINLVMQFSEGIEPRKAEGIEHRIVPGQVLFSPIKDIQPGQELTFEVSAEAMKSGTHIFRAQLTCDASESREIAEGTTRFFGEDVAPATAKATDNGFDPGLRNK